MTTKTTKLCPSYEERQAEVYEGDNPHKQNTVFCKQCGRVEVDALKRRKDGELEEDITAAGPSEEGSHASKTQITEDGIRQSGHTSPDSIERSAPSGDAPQDKGKVADVKK